MVDLFEGYNVLVYAAISIISMLIGYSFAVTAIMKQSGENTELRVNILEILNRERALLDEYREFVQETKTVNQYMKRFLDQNFN